MENTDVIIAWTAQWEKWTRLWNGTANMDKDKLKSYNGL